MQKEIDLLSFLSRVTEKNTKHYRSDFLYDSRKLQEAAQAAAPEERCFFWMSRPSGTCELPRTGAACSDSRDPCHIGDTAL